MISEVYNWSLYLDTLNIALVTTLLTTHTLYFTTSSLLFPLILKTTITNSIVFALKFIILIALLVFIRGGIPRYRYDFLTKIGWVKFLSLVLAVFLASLSLTFVY